MTKTTLKKNIHKAIDNIDDAALLEAVYTLLNKASIYNDDYEWTAQDLRIVEERKANYLSGKTKSMSMSELNKRLRKRFSK